MRTVDISGSGQEQQVSFMLNTDEEVTVDKQHFLKVEQDDESGEPHPTVHVRNGLFALLSRSVFYQLVEAAESRQDKQQTALGIRSAGEFFELGKVEP